MKATLTPVAIARRSKGLSQKQLSASTGIGQSTLSKIEKTGKASRKQATVLASALGLNELQVLYPERYPIQISSSPVTT